MSGLCPQNSPCFLNLAPAFRANSQGNTMHTARPTVLVRERPEVQIFSAAPFNMLILQHFSFQKYQYKHCSPVQSKGFRGRFLYAQIISHCF